MNPTRIPDPAEIVDTIRSGLRRLLPPEELQNVDLDELSLQTPLLSLPIDSAVLMALMTELEDAFAVFIDEEAAFSFESVSQVSHYIRQRLAEKARRLNES